MGGKEKISYVDITSVDTLELTRLKEDDDPSSVFGHLDGGELMVKPT